MKIILDNWVALQQVWMNHLMEIWNQKSKVGFLCKKPDDYL